MSNIIDQAEKIIAANGFADSTFAPFPPFVSPPRVASIPPQPRLGS